MARIARISFQELKEGRLIFYLGRLDIMENILLIIDLHVGT
jgi:hypothetical protein